MSGTELKKLLTDEGIMLAELSRMLGYDSDQRLHSYLTAKDVKSGLIEDIAKVLHWPLSMFYPELEERPVDDIGVRLAAIIEKKDEQIDKLLNLLCKYESKS